MQNDDLNTPQQTTEDGLHCVYGKCQGIPYSNRPCNPGCYFQMSAVSELELIYRTGRTELQRLKEHLAQVVIVARAHGATEEELQYVP
jgi:hypothetical protein